MRYTYLPPDHVGNSWRNASWVHRFMAHGGRAWWVLKALKGCEVGGYLLEGVDTNGFASVVKAVDIEVAPSEVDAHCRPLRYPNVCLYYGPASNYLMHACYGYVLDLFGLSYRGVAEWDIAGGALDEASLLVVPGGFAVHGLDKDERSAGAGKNVRAFIERGGGYIGSCGGMFYLCSGQPDWLGLFSASPLFPQEWWVTGTGVVSLKLSPESPVAVHCPPTMEVQYYHGPVVPAVGPGTEAVARFDQYSLPTVNYFDNPLQREMFDASMKGNVAAVLTHHGRGGAVGFSPHPEIGEIFRKYSGYSYHGRGRSEDDVAYFTHLGRYQYRESAQFRLVLNSIHYLSTLADVPEAAPRPLEAQESADAVSGLGEYTAVCDAWEQVLKTLSGRERKARAMMLDLALHQVRSARQHAEELRDEVRRVGSAGAAGATLLPRQAAIDVERAVRWARELTRKDDGALWMMRQMEVGRYCAPRLSDLPVLCSGKGADVEALAAMGLAHVACTAELTGENMRSICDRIRSLLAEKTAVE